MTYGHCFSNFDGFWNYSTFEWLIDKLLTGRDISYFTSFKNMHDISSYTKLFFAFIFVIILYHSNGSVGLRKMEFVVSMFQVSGIWFLWIGNLRCQITSNICKVGTKAFANIFWVRYFCVANTKAIRYRCFITHCPITNFNTHRVFDTSPLNLYKSLLPFELA